MVVTQLPAQRSAPEARRGDWWMSAACRETDPELFFPVTAHGLGARDTDRAKAVCATCRVRRQCLQYALATHQVHGVWGGMTEGERQLHVHREREREREQHGQREHSREHAQCAHRDPVRPERGEPGGGNGARNRGGRLRSV